MIAATERPVVAAERPAFLTDGRVRWAGDACCGNDRLAAMPVLVH
jgi:hypothetical protein